MVKQWRQLQIEGYWLFFLWIQMFYLSCVNAIRVSFLSVTLKFDEALTEVKHLLCCCAAVLTGITSADCSCPKTRFCWARGHMNQLTKCDLKSCPVTVWGTVCTNCADDVSKVSTQRRVCICDRSVTVCTLSDSILVLTYTQTQACCRGGHSECPTPHSNTSRRHENSLIRSVKPQHSRTSGLKIKLLRPS